MNVRRAWIGAAVLLFVMALLMVGPAREDSATVDETAHLAIGYLGLKGSHTRLGGEEHPPLGQMLEASPLLFMDVKYPDPARAILRGELGYGWMLSWAGKVLSIRDLVPPGCEGRYVQLPPLGDQMVQWHCTSKYPLDNWYYWAAAEGQMFGKYLVYGGLNDGDAMLFAGRLVQIALTLLTGVVIFVWTRRATGQDIAALVALALWVFSPAALAYGHLTNTDIGVTFGATLAIYLFARLLDQPSLTRAAICSVATAVALVMKYTALMLAPIFLVALALRWKRLKPPVAEACKMAGVFFLAGWIVALVVFLPWLAPAPPPTQTDLALFDLPGWFTALRPILVPSGLFKGIGLMLGHSKSGHDAYLVGAWSHKGWWYFFPVALVLKSPVSFVILIAGALTAFLKGVKHAGTLESMPWLAAGIFLACAMTSNANIGVRHMLPMFPLLCVGIGCASSRLANPKLKIAGLSLLGWQIVSVLLAYPLYIQFFSEAVGGAHNGYKYLFDSNFDWGQDAKRLKKFLDERHINHIYLDYFGTQFSIEYLKIPNTRVDAERAKQIRQGTLVVSASQLVRPEWAWLRESRQPVDRIAHTLFVYQFP
jgi:hypothetical protein